MSINNNEEKGATGLDKEFEDIQKMSDGYVDNENAPEEKKDDEPEESDKDESPEDHKGEDDPSEEEDESESDDEPESDDPEGEDGDESEEDEDPKKPSRPMNYIPMKKYHEEKRLWKQKVNELENRLKDTDKGSKEESNVIKTFAEKHGYEPSEISELVGVLRSEFGVDDLQQQSKARQEEMEIKAFNEEYKVLETKLKEEFPNASPAELKKARQKMDELAFSEWGHDKELDYILYKNKNTFNKIFGTGESKRPVETTSRGNKSFDKELSAKDFRGKKDFQKLQDLPEEKRRKIVSDLAPEDYANYGSWLQASEDEIEVKRDGRVIRLR